MGHNIEVLQEEDVQALTLSEAQRIKEIPADRLAVTHMLPDPLNDSLGGTRRGRSMSGRQRLLRCPISRDPPVCRDLP